VRAPEGAAQPIEAAPAGSLQAQVHALQADAAAHWRAALRESPHAVDYLRRRGIRGAIATRFGLGYARARWRDLAEVLECHSAEAVDASGLLAGKTGGTDARRFDRFRGRIMFPIRDRAGNVAGFGGRVLDDADQPKYLNSPEGVAFHKGRLLYGLFEAEAGIRAEGLAVVVEGYLDVVSLTQGGFGAAVATLGTACRREQIEALLALTRSVVFCFDGDTAGRAAAARALEMVLPLATDARRFRFMLLPSEHDPDSFVRAHGLEAWRAALESSLSLSAFLIEHVQSGCDLRYAEGRAQCSARARPLWHAMADSLARQALLEHCAAVLRFSTTQILSLFCDSFGSRP
jgi:DNA primase